MSKRMNSSDPDIRGSLAAIRRAARSARTLAAKTRTPIYVLRHGRVQKLSPARARSASRSKHKG